MSTFASSGRPTKLSVVILDNADDQAALRDAYITARETRADKMREFLSDDGVIDAAEYVELKRFDFDEQMTDAVWFDMLQRLRGVAVDPNRSYDPPEPEAA